MQIVEDQIRQSVEELWSSVLGLAIEPRAGFPASSPGLLTGCVEISGNWQGAVTIECGPILARRAAGIMFGIDPAQTSFDQVQDALGELTNILGGQFKALLPEPCRLSLPAVAEEADNAFGRRNDKILARVAFACQEIPLRVTIVEGAR